MLGVVNARFAMLSAARFVQVQMVECKPTLQHHARPGFSFSTVSCPFLFSGNCFRRINMVRRRRSCYKRCIMLNFGDSRDFPPFDLVVRLATYARRCPSGL